MDIVHTTYPLHMATCFKVFGNAFLLRHLSYKLRKHILGLLVNFGQIEVQLA